MAQQAETQKCRRCKTNDAAHTIRAEHLCGDCFCRFVSTKTVKRLEVLNREISWSLAAAARAEAGAGGAPSLQAPAASSRPATPKPRPKPTKPANKTFLVGLSFGPSSAALVDICEDIIAGQLAKNRDAAFTLHVVHVDDTDLGGEGESTAGEDDKASLLDAWRQRYPRFTFERLPLSAVCKLDSIDWALLFPGQSVSGSREESSTSLRTLLDRLPSPTSRQDVTGILVRRLLVAHTIAGNYSALFLGCSTTALAERTLAETAKGRGFSLPWQINDGPVEVNGGSASNSATVPLYYPLRELFRKELATYTTLVKPSIQELIRPLPRSASANGSAPAPPAVVSHKDLSIEEVMIRYFAEVEENYPSVVANVVKTTTKLERNGGILDDDSQHGCGVCGMPLDEAGNERWKGEIGDYDEDHSPENGLGQVSLTGRRLCYGCERSVRG